MKLYGYYRSSASYRVRIILNIKGIDWEYVSVNLAKGDQMSAEHEGRNPMKLVPVLDTGDAVLAQSVAIGEYLEATHPQPPLMPSDEIEKAKLREMVQMIASDTQPIGNLRVLKYVDSEFSVGDEGMARWAREWIGRGLAAFEKRVVENSSDGKYCYGDALTLADAFIVPQVYNADRFGLDMEPLPAIRGVMTHLNTIDAIAAAHPSVPPDAPN